MTPRIRRGHAATGKKKRKAEGAEPGHERTYRMKGVTLAMRS